MREVRIRDTLSGEERAVEAGPGGEVGIYACGPTTYGPIHIGNARPYVVFMLLRRFLAHEGYRPKLVVNLTDVNDKIYEAARERGVSSAAHAEEMVAGYVADTDALGLGRPDAEPKATETIGPIVGLIEDLVATGHAYEAGGDVYFRVRGFASYGELSNRDPDAMDQGEEAGSAELKEDRLDFALWKARKPGEDTAWPSPWGEGRPGWHIECSAMAEELLGLGFAIHGGGADLVFPHHENERAQTEAARERPLARIWMHNGMVEARRGGGDAEKMAKSVGNVFLLGEAIRAHGAAAVIGFLVAGHYRQPLAFSEAALEEAAARNRRIREFLREGADPPGEADTAVRRRREAFLDALADDFNTPRALAELFGLVADARREPLPGARAVVTELLGLLGLESLAAAGEDDRDEEADRLLAARERARAERDFDRADELRDRLGELGWEVRDTAEGARLVRRGG
ncbi:MAG: cysteine--tRNA ligase [Acidobacteria bacterium]|nr:MAG: cysteine--tRNA ligase [Acidobacteriota bacterium]MCL4287566.1 cysteine--tRNA ligase [Thermoleophilia bacterium]GIK77561.1 MAG: cysteine--tRNA ligase [Actinomycetes bacterium]